MPKSIVSRQIYTLLEKFPEWTIMIIYSINYLEIAVSKKNSNEALGPVQMSYNVLKNISEKEIIHLLYEKIGRIQNTQ